MRLLYISYWGINDVLTEATVFPNLRILKPYFDEIYLATVERGKTIEKEIPEKIIHVPFYSTGRWPRFIRKVLDYSLFSLKLFRVARTRKIDLVICRGSMAAAFGLFLNRVSHKPFIVESFEPHADYMEEGDTWNKHGLEYTFQKWVEAQSIRYARYLLPVTENFARFLILNGVPAERVMVLPCCVDIEKFVFNPAVRKQVRDRLMIPNDRIAGIYVGKFGDIYLKDEAFIIFQKAKEIFSDNFFLIILTPQPKEDVEKRLLATGFKQSNIFVGYVDHRDVPDYLSAADFAFSLIRPSKSRKYCSPIKNGEYWANGLPIVLTKGVGDDERIIKSHQAGVILDIEISDIRPSLEEIKHLLSNGRLSLSEKITPLAKQYRNFMLIEASYSKILK